MIAVTAAIVAGRARDAVKVKSAIDCFSMSQGFRMDELTAELGFIFWFYAAMRSMRRFTVLDCDATSFVSSAILSDCC